MKSIWNIEWENGDKSRWSNYISNEEADIASALKADVEVLTNDYVTKDQPEFNLTESNRLNEEKNPLSDDN